MSIGINASQAFSPNKLSNLVLWLDATDPSTIVESGGLVSEWKDKSKDGNDVFQDTGSSKPTTGVGTINGLNALAFDGIDDFLKRSAFTGGSISQPNTIFIVVELDAISLTKKFFDGSINFSRHTLEHISSKLSLFSGTSVDGSIVLTINTPYVFSALFDSPSIFSNSECYINGVLDIFGTSGSQVLSGITIAARFNAAQRMNGKIGEFIIYDQGLSTTDRVRVQQYLFNKWRISPTSYHDLFPLVFSSDFSSDFS